MRSRADLGQCAIALSCVRLPYMEGRRLLTHHVCHSGGEQAWGLLHSLTQIKYSKLLPSETVFESNFWFYFAYISNSHFIHSMESLRRTELLKASTVSTCNSFAFHAQFLVSYVTYQQIYGNGICEPKSHPGSTLVPMFINQIKSL